MGKRGPKLAESIVTAELCSYGCGSVAKYKNSSGNLMCDTHSNKCPAIKKKNSDGLKSCGRDYSADYKKLPEESKLKMNTRKGKRFAIFGFPGSGRFKNALLLERGHQCECCKLTEWLGKPITLELEHTDGIKQNNTRENLRLLCPNCHSQTPTWRRKKSALLDK